MKVFESKNKRLVVVDELKDGKLGFLFIVREPYNDNMMRLEANEAIKLIAALESRL